MTKTIAQIQFEMETVKLIKSALDVNGTNAYELLKEWTTEEEKGNLTIKDNQGEITLEASKDGGIKFSGNVGFSKAEVKNDHFTSSQDIKEIKETLDGLVKLVCASSGIEFN